MLEQSTILAGRYRVVRDLGSGGMGTVVLAHDEKLRREVAIKRLHAGGGEDAARRIQREAKLGAALTHPNLVTIFDAIIEDASLIIVMEHVDGENLAERLKGGRLAPADALAVLEPVAAALDHAHAHGIVHRDVKPANVLLGERGAVKLADLGVAIAEDHSRITRDGALVGSLPYMAPEQLEPVGAGPASDVYALAAIAYEALSGQRARQGRSPVELARAAAENPAPDLREVAPDLPAAAASVLAAGMAKDPEARPASAGMLIRDLQDALAPKPAPASKPAAVAATAPVTAPAAPPPTRPRPAAPAPSPAGRRRGPALLGLLALIAVGVALVIVLSGGEDNPPQQAETPQATQAQPDATASGETDAETGTEGETDVAPASPATGAGDDPSTPAGAVRTFYESAAADDFDTAWALAGPEMRAAFGDSQESFEADLGSLESIRFKTLTEGAAGPGGTPVTVETVARHTDRTDRCTGDLLAVPDGADGFLVDPAGVSCSSS